MVVDGDFSLMETYENSCPISETPKQGQNEIISQTPSYADTYTDAEAVDLFQTLPVFEQ